MVLVTTLNVEESEGRQTVTDLLRLYSKRNRITVFITQGPAPPSIEHEIVNRAISCTSCHVIRRARDFKPRLLTLSPAYFTAS